jgi:hypothetical protein
MGALVGMPLQGRGRGQGSDGETPLPGRQFGTPSPAALQGDDVPLEPFEKIHIFSGNLRHFAQPEKNQVRNLLL